jgi:hypothetical protein
LAFSQSWDKRNTSSITLNLDKKRNISLMNELTKMPLRSNAWTAFAFWSTAGGRAKGFSRKSTEGISNNRRCLAKRHFGQQASERLKPKCP